MLTDYYKILGLTRNATQKEIIKAFRKKALEFHPDKNKSPNVHELFIQINQAYEILGNTNTRKQYDFLYDKYIGKKQTTYTQQKEQHWAETVKTATETGRQKGEKYVADFNYFSTRVLKTALLTLFTEVIISLIFGEVSNIGILLGLILSIGGVIITAKYFANNYIPNLIGGLIMTVVGILIIHWQLKEYAKEINATKK